MRKLKKPSSIQTLKGMYLDDVSLWCTPNQRKFVENFSRENIPIVIYRSTKSESPKRVCVEMSGEKVSKNHNFFYLFRSLAISHTATLKAGCVYMKSIVRKNRCAFCLLHPERQLSKFPRPNVTPFGDVNRISSAAQRAIEKFTIVHSFVLENLKFTNIFLLLNRSSNFRQII